MIELEQIQQAAQLLGSSTDVVALTGAGVSTEAGIPDFRSPESGLWNNVELMASFSAWGFRLAPGRFYKNALKLLPPLLDAQPTVTHHLLAELERVGKLTCLITQNIDGLHQQAGSNNVIELHGTYRTGRCLKCHTSYPLEKLLEKVRQQETPPLCELCRGTIKPDLVLFGDVMPMAAWSQASQAAQRCDLMIVLGSSLVVYPAADLPQQALAAGAKLLIVNREPTPYDAQAALAINAELAEFSQCLREQLHPDQRET
jgi:NAD-dependent deacetylase